MRISLATSPKKAIFAPLLFAGHLDHALHRVAELGYEGVELNIQDPSRLDHAALAARVRSSGLQVVALGTGQAYIEEGLCLATNDPEQRRCILRAMCGRC